MPGVSVVVPTRDRPQSLRRCLAAVALQPPGSVAEILVVDDGTGEGARDDALGAGPGVTHVLRTHGAGPAAGRNAGAQAARSPIVCFVDDDCEPAADWAPRLAAAIDTGADAVAGATVAPAQAGAYAAASQLMTNHLARHASVPFGPTSNLAARAELLRAEPFDERFPEAAGEDREWCARISRAGYRLRREPRAVVLHHQRLDLGGFARQQLRYGRGAHAFRRRHGTEPAAFHAGLLRAGFRRGAVSGTLVLLAQAMIGAGLVQARLGDR